MSKKKEIGETIDYDGSSFKDERPMWKRVWEWRETRGDQITGAYRDPKKIMDELKTKSRRERYMTPPVFRVGKLVQPEENAAFPCLKLTMTSAISGFIFGSLCGTPIGALKTTLVGTRTNPAIAFSMAVLLQESVAYGLRAGCWYGTYLGSFRGINCVNEHKLGYKNTKTSVTASGAVSGALATGLMVGRGPYRLPAVALGAIGCGSSLYIAMTYAGVDEL